MKHRNAVHAANQTALAIRWAQTHTLQDLDDLVNEMSSLGEDVTDIGQLLVDLHEIDRSLQADTLAGPEPEASEYAAMTA